MKKISQLVLSILFMFPLIVGSFSTIGLFQFLQNGENTQILTLSMGGGGQNPLIGDTIPDYPQNDDDKNEMQPVSAIEYTYKTYEDYFVDLFGCSYTEDEQGIKVLDYTNATKPETLTGLGTSSNPYLINNIKDFLWLTNENCNTANMQNSFMQLNADLIFNDEIFDKDGNPTGGDGVVYSWKSVKAGWASSLDGNNFSMKGYYVVDGASSNSVFSDTREVVQNIVF